MKRIVVSVVLTALVAVAAAGAGMTVNLPTLFKAPIAKAKAKTSVPVLLPTTLVLIDKMKLYGTVETVSKGAYSLELDAAPNCHTATACFIAGFSGEQGGTLPGASNVTLGNGDKAWFHPSTCGGSCSPVSFEFVHAGVLYSFQDSDMTAKNAKATMIALANDAISAGPR